MDDHTTMLSRSGRTDAEGKLTRRVDVPVTEEMEAQIIALATIANVPKTEWVRYQLDLILNGKVSMLRRMTQKGPGQQWDESGRNGE